MKSFKDKKELLTVLILFGLVLFIRTVYIPTGKVWYDEIVSITAAKQSLGEIYKLASVETNTPTYYMLLHYYIQLFGDGEVTLRLLSVFFGLLSSFTIFLLAKELAKDKLVPKIALFLVAVSPFHLYYSHEIRVYSILIFLSSLTLLSLVKLLRGKGPRTFWDMCYVASIVLGVYLHITYLFYILTLNVFLLVEVLHGRRRDLLVRSLLFPDIVLVGSAVFFCAMGHPVIIPQIANVIRMKLAASKNPMYGIRVEDFLSVVVRVYWGKFVFPSAVVATATLFYLGLKRLRSNRRYPLLFVAIMATSLFIPPRLPDSSRYVAYAFPAVLTLMAFGAHCIWQMLGNFGGKSFRPSKVLVVGAAVVAVVFPLQASVNTRWNGYSRVALFFEANRITEAVVLVTPSWDRYVLLHYFKEPVTIKGVHTRLDEFGQGLPLVENLSANWQPIVDEPTVANLENYIRGFKNVWYVNFDPSSDPENLVLRWLVENVHLEKIYYVGCSEIRDDSTTKMPVFLFRNDGI